MQMLRTRQVTIGADGTVKDSQGGGFLQLVSVSDETAVDIIWLSDRDIESGKVTGVYIGQKFHPGAEFAGVKIVGTAGAVVVFLVGPGGADADLADFDALITNSVDQPVPVAVQGSLTLSPDVTVSNVVEVKEGEAGSLIQNTAPVAATDVIETLVAASAVRRSFFARNIGPDAVALVGPAGTFADAAIVLQMGETWKEKEGAQAQWCVICDADATATVNVCEVIYD